MTCQKMFHGRMGNSMVTLHCSSLAAELPRTDGSTLFLIFSAFCHCKIWRSPDGFRAEAAEGEVIHRGGAVWRHMGLPGSQTLELHVSDGQTWNSPDCSSDLVKTKIVTTFLSKSCFVKNTPFCWFFQFRSFNFFGLFQRQESEKPRSSESQPGSRLDLRGWIQKLSVFFEWKRKTRFSTV